MQFVKIYKKYWYMLKNDENSVIIKSNAEITCYWKKEEYILLLINILKLSLLKEGENKYVGNRWKSVVLWNR